MRRVASTSAASPGGRQAGTRFRRRRAGFRASRRRRAARPKCARALGESEGRHQRDEAAECDRAAAGRERVSEDRDDGGSRRAAGVPRNRETRASAGAVASYGRAAGMTPLFDTEMIAIRIIACQDSVPRLRRKWRSCIRRVQRAVGQVQAQAGGGGRRGLRRFQARIDAEERSSRRTGCRMPTGRPLSGKISACAIPRSSACCPRATGSRVRRRSCASHPDRQGAG